MNYQIIKNKERFLEFIEWLPELEENEKYFLSLFARKKYCKELIKSNDKTQLRRFTSNKERMYDKVKQLECEVGSYKLRDMDVPQESLVLYINPNPRNMRRATFDLLKNGLKLLEYNSKGYNIHAEALSSIQRSKSKSHFCDFDVDNKLANMQLMNRVLPGGEYSILKTRGGFHILVHTRIAPKTMWHQTIRNLYDVDNVGDQLIPVPGCVQGGFSPELVKP